MTDKIKVRWTFDDTLAFLRGKGWGESRYVYPLGQGRKARVAYVEGGRWTNLSWHSNVRFESLAEAREWARQWAAENRVGFVRNPGGARTPPHRR